jgi:tricorn protease
MLSGDRSTVVERRWDQLYAFDGNGKVPENIGRAQIDLSAVAVEISPAEEWRGMFVDAWRLHRDYFYDPEMHGVDWLGVRKRHEALLPRVSDRWELDDLIGMMVGELSAMHTDIRPGDVRTGDEGASVAHLGARIRFDQKAGGHVIEHIYRRDPDYPDQLSPLDKPGMDIKEGDVVVAVDGRPSTTVTDLSQLLIGKSGRQVLLEVKRRGFFGGKKRQFIVYPLGGDAFRDLKLGEWEYTRRLAVEEGGGGDIGYFHMRAMGAENFAEFVRGFYPVVDRKGLIIDMRQNYGGNIDSWVLSRLMRKAWMWWQARTGRPYPNMHFAFGGHMVVLVDAFTISDGEAFSEGFRRLGLGKVIGTRTWGGGIWLRGNNRLVDGGLARSPEFGVYAPEGVWLVEGEGVEPDMVVDNPPHATFKGEDAQLQAALEYLKKKIEEQPPTVPQAPERPNKSGG